MVVSVHELTGFQRDLLYVIAGSDHPTGQIVREELERSTGREITHGRLYPNLDALVEAGLVEKGARNRRSNFYELTDDGKEALQLRRRWENELYGKLMTTHG
ncbi:transcriptional regulator, acidobacterial, PadR-family [Halolamina pelagica]|uniref:Transcriptional regulator, acidobacterial, PadR-family n=1 Tax=Halolamina pelagica TaxID=699431 RepID=A0A0P7GUK4_9EURY|nr:PadR family transcriptional regulator [Halolamina pelagica]KPN29162.1 transcriptional regulator, acidobacterial, PadR-family [Halolamina pelagica]